MDEYATARSGSDARGPEPVRIDGHLEIGDYAAIGDGRTLALVGLDGSIDWMCLPRLYSTSVFGALLDPNHGGRFTLAPEAPFSVSRQYLERTNVLETTFETDTGTAVLLDALTIDRAPTLPVPGRELIRHVHAVAGSVRMRWRMEPRYGYGRRPAQFDLCGPLLLSRDGNLQLGLRAWDAGEPEIRDGAVGATFDVRQDRQAVLVLVCDEQAPLRVPERAAVLRRLTDTMHQWRSWVARHHYGGPWRDAVERSLLAIGLLADGESGAIAAAGTTSLPEVLGGERNFDYRYGWVRDVSFTLDALLGVGMGELAQGSVRWLLDAVRRTQPRIDPVYSLRGEVVRGQHQLPLPGYRGSVPVHVGNNAGSQLQLGGFGDLTETVASCVEHGHVLAPADGERLADSADLLARIWQTEDAGLWELSDRAHYGTSKLGCWVAFERLLDLVRAGQVPPRHEAQWRRERERLGEFIETRLFSLARNSYLFKAGSEELDCGMLLAARRSFGGRDRLAGTIDAITSELGAGGPLLYRYSGMQEQENAFLACSFWMVEASALAGRVEQAAERMQAAVDLASDVGLYSEEMEPGTGAMRGNLPQALTHLALISAAHVLERCTSGSAEVAAG